MLHVHADLGVAGLGGEVVLEPLAVGPTLAVGLAFLDGVNPDCGLGGFQKCNFALGCLQLLFALVLYGDGDRKLFLSN